jgi:hypothetical protein
MMPDKTLPTDPAVSLEGLPPVYISSLKALRDAADDLSALLAGRSSEGALKESLERLEAAEVRFRPRYLALVARGLTSEHNADAAQTLTRAGEVYGRAALKVQLSAR